MVKAVGAFLGLFTAVFTLMSAVGLLGTFLSLRTVMAGFSTASTGLIMGSYFLGLALGPLLGRRVVERVGHIRSFAAFAAVAAATALAHGLLLDAVSWAVLRFMTGAAMFGLYMVIESWLNECTAPQMRGRVFSVYMVLSYCGMAFGQLLLNLGDPQGARLFMVAGMLFVLCLIPVSVTAGVSPRLPAASRFNLLRLLRQAPVGMLGCFAAGVVNGAFYALGPVFCTRIGLSVSETAWFMTAAILGGLALQWPMGAVSDRFDRPFVISALAAALALVSLAVKPAAADGTLPRLAVMALFGGLAFTIYPVSVARAHDLFEPNEIVPVSSALILCYAAGASLGPVAAARAMTAAGQPFGLFAFVSLVAAAVSAAVFVLRKTEKVTVVTVEDQAPFLPMKSTTPVAMEMDPRAE